MLSYIMTVSCRQRRESVAIPTPSGRVAQLAEQLTLNQ